MYCFRREELQLHWNAVQRLKGRKVVQLCTTIRVAQCPKEGPYNKYIRSYTKDLEKLLEDEPEQDEVAAFFSKLPGGAQSRRSK